MRVRHKIGAEGRSGALATGRIAAEAKATDATSGLLHALHDVLTGLGNRQMLHQRFEEGRRRRSIEALLYVDLDGFKAVNDAFGHSVGDRLLQAVAVRMGDCLRDTDVVARFGGDQFVVLLSRTERHDGLDTVALRLLRTLSRTFAIGDFDIDIGASIGSVLCYPEDLGLDALIARADIALTHAKGSGRGRHIRFDRTDGLPAERCRVVK